VNEPGVLPVTILNRAEPALIGAADRSRRDREARPIRRSQLRNRLEQSAALGDPPRMPTGEAAEAPL
jgi:hypothetical protein